MTEQTNPTQEDNETIPAVEFPAVEFPAAEFSDVPSAEIVSALDVQLGVTEDVSDEAAEELLEAAEEAEEEEEVNAGPGEYVEQERGGRTRRTATDIRLEDVHYRNIAVLSRFLDRRGRILSRRKTRVSAKMQRRVVREIKRARHLSLLPYTADQTRIVRRRK